MITLLLMGGLLVSAALVIREIEAINNRKLLGSEISRANRALVEASDRIQRLQNDVAALEHVLISHRIVNREDLKTCRGRGERGLERVAEPAEQPDGRVTVPGSCKLH